MKTRFLLLALFTLSVKGFSQDVWEPQAENLLPSNYSVMNISIVSEQVAWAVALDYSQWASPVPPTHLLKVLRTTDGGATWSVNDFTQAPGRMTLGIHALDENTALLGTSNFSNTDELFRTTNGGNSWTQVLSGGAGSGRVQFFNAQEGVSVDPGFAMARSNNGGVSWTLLLPGMDYPPFLTGENHLNTPTNWNIVGDTFWIGTTKGRLYRSTDKGQSWTVHQATSANNAFVSIAFVDNKNGLALVGDFNNPPLKLIKTIDGGENWDEISNSDNLSEVLAIPCTNSILGVSWFDNLTVWSTNLGYSWEVLDASLKLFGPAFSSPETGWITNGDVTGANPALYKWSGAPLAGRTYVNQNAAGANDGSTWADAFTNLQAALTAAEAGDEIWVAEGTYLPDTAGGNPAATFLIDKNLKLYGGFAGSECNLSERDVLEHPSVLSGDLNGNDIDDNFTTNRGDNVLHVVQVNANITNETLIDGFTIEGGHADGPTGQRAGGGLVCMGEPIIRQCIFEQNYALEAGGGLQLTDPSNGAAVEGCLFRHNLANSGGGLVIRSPQYTVEGCTFSGNATFSGQNEAHGGGVFIFASQGIFKNCHFTDNAAVDNGGGLFEWSADWFSGALLALEGCVFENNTAGLNGGAVSFIPWGDNATYSLISCDFLENEGTTDAGGLHFFANSNSNNAAFTMTGCLFSKNTATNNGSGFWAGIAGKNAEVELQNCQFTENTASNFSAAADFWGTNGGTGLVLVDSCLFENNTSFWSGAVEMGNGHNGGASVNFTLSNSTFKSNEATEGGAIGLWSDELSNTNFLVENCVVDGNEGTIKGGGILFYPTGSNYQATVRNTRIVNNSSPDGGGIDSYIDGVPFPSGASVLLENCLISGNFSDNAAISVDSLPNLNLLNCTIAGNQSGGIQIGDKSVLTFQNTIFYNPGFTEYTATTTDASFTSHGGNLIGDLSLDGQLTPGDKQNLDPLFVAPGDYHLTESSPCVDAGVDAGVTATTDLDGNARIQGLRVDMGAYESPFTAVAAKEVVAGEVALSPNPAGDFLTIQLLEASASLDVQVFDAQGRAASRQLLAAGQPIDLKALQPGIYLLKVTAGERQFAGKFVKQ